MSEQQATTVLPSDSASNVGKSKKPRPGKAQRAAAREMVTPSASAVTASSSMTGASSFSSRKIFAPVPQPGKYPVVFPSGAGEPTKDSRFALDPSVICDVFKEIPSSMSNAARFAEFSAHAEYDKESFGKDIAKNTLLSIAQQIVHAHTNMQLPMGDFSSIATTDTYMMSSVRSIVSQFGEFSVEPLGTRYILADYETTVTSLVVAADLSISLLLLLVTFRSISRRCGFPLVLMMLERRLSSQSGFLSFSEA